MKFACERCGKRYATAEDPAPGRVYKLKCKACGHLIVVKASPNPTSGAVSAPPPLRSGPPASTAGLVERAPAPDPGSGVHVEIGAPEPAQPDGRSAEAPPWPGAATTEISTTAASPRGAAAPPEATMAGGDAGAPAPAGRLGTGEAAPPAAPAPASGEAPPGYVDLFADGVPPAEASGEAQGPDDPFLAAARASLPDGYGSAGGAPAPLAPLRDWLSQGEAGADEPARPPQPSAQVPVIPKPPPHRRALPIALIGVGAAALVGILAFVLLSSGKGAPAPAPRSRVAAAQVAPPAQAAPPPQAAPADRAAPPAGDPQPSAAREPDDSRSEPADSARAKGAAAEDRRARDERRRREREEAKEREARARAEREAREREKAERARADAARVAGANLLEAKSALSQEEIEKVLLSTRKAFDACIQEAKAGGAKLDGRRVILRLNIQGSGAVTYPTLDDVTLNATDLGSCLKSAARLMVFPKFKGDTMHVEVPLVLSP